MSSDQVTGSNWIVPCSLSQKGVSWNQKANCWGFRIAICRLPITNRPDTGPAASRAFREQDTLRQEPMNHELS
jgi:hypothetical protein